MKNIQVIYMLIVLFMFSNKTLTAQPDATERKPANTRLEHEKSYKERIAKEEIDGVYIPKDVTEAFSELDRLISSDGKNKFRAATEETVTKKLFFSLGRWVSYNWGFYEGSRLSHHLKEKFNLSHPDDMAIFIITAYHRSLNKKPIDIQPLAEKIKQKRLADLKDRRN